MMPRTEIEALARTNRTNPYFQEKHYLMSLMLSSLYSRTERQLVFKGGTYLWFFHRLPRASEDLDFTAVGDVVMGQLVEGVVADLAIYGLGATHRIERSRESFTARVAVEGPLFDGRNRSTVRIEVSLRGDVEREPVFLAFRSPYSDAPDFSLLGMDLEEVLAEKVRAMMWRRRARDLYDIHHILVMGVNIDMDLVESKLKYYDIRPSARLLEDAIDEIGGVWKAELSPLIKGPRPDFKTVAGAVKTRLESFGQG
jgi:hypothetical protein